MRLVLGVGLIGLIVVLLLGPSLAYSQMNAGRQANADVVSDDSGVLGLVVNGTVQNCQRQDLVDVTNHFTQSLDVTVSLADGSIGTLYNTVNSDSGDSVTFTLTSGSAGTVELDADYSGGTPTSFSFDITASDPGLSVYATRSSTLEGPGSCGGGGGPPGGGPP